MKVYTLENIYSSQLNKNKKTGKTSFDTCVTTNHIEISLQKGHVLRTQLAMKQLQINTGVADSNINGMAITSLVF